MTKILKFVLILIAIWLILNTVSLIFRRARLYFRISRLSRELGAEVKYLKPPFLSLFRLSRTPELSVRLGGSLYLIRIFNGGGIGKVVHFASKRYSVRFSRLRTAVYVKLRGREKLVTARSGIAVGTKVISVPDLDTSRQDIPEGVRVVETLIFNPAPGEVSYVTEEKTSIRVAFTGDEVLGTRIFTSSTFGAFVGREYRREEYEASLARVENRASSVSSSDLQNMDSPEVSDTGTLNTPSMVSPETAEADSQWFRNTDSPETSLSPDFPEPAAKQ